MSENNIFNTEINLINSENLVKVNCLKNVY